MTGVINALQRRAPKSLAPSFHWIYEPMIYEVQVPPLGDFPSCLTHWRTALLTFRTFLLVVPTALPVIYLCCHPVLFVNIEVSTASHWRRLQVYQVATPRDLISSIHYQGFLLDTNPFSWTTCSEHNPGQHPSSSISKWMKCSNKCRRMRTQVLHVKTDTENKHQPFPWLFPKCILQICGSYPAGVPSPGCLPRDCLALYELPRFAFVCLLVILVPSAVPSLHRASSFSQKIRDGNFRVLFLVRRWSLFCEWGHLFKSSVQLKDRPVYEIK